MIDLFLSASIQAALEVIRGFWYPDQGRKNSKFSGRGTGIPENRNEYCIHRNYGLLNQAFCPDRP